MGAKAERGRLPRARRATWEPRGGTVSELSFVVETAAGACAPSVGASVRLMSGDMAGALRATFRAEGLASGSACRALQLSCLLPLACCHQQDSTHVQGRQQGTQEAATIFRCPVMAREIHAWPACVPDAIHGSSRIQT